MPDVTCKKNNLIILNDVNDSDTYLSEHHVLAVQPRALNSGNEELGAVGVGASVGHGQQACNKSSSQ
jgi:hypothetical protein